ncbi:MAG: hypothetical protein M1829_006420 [Trizodia sp. TS-e1964]|nr:MAG: hypothetical protein M1829_006420 [Trizodia sp. TS-e1964]
MLLNKNTVVHVAGINLIPYLKAHVPIYHAWMQDENLQRATASEALTLEEEYAMQRSWRHDADKLTFIIKLDDRLSPDSNLPSRLLGDVNLFLSADEEGEGVVGELEIMIAPVEYRGRGFGQIALEAMLSYIKRHDSEIVKEYYGTAWNDVPEEGRGLKYLRAKIGEGNRRSADLFERNGFKMVAGGPNYFGDCEFRRGVRSRDKLRGVEWEDSDDSENDLDCDSEPEDTGSDDGGEYGEKIIEDEYEDEG